MFQSSSPSCHAHCMHHHLQHASYQQHGDQHRVRLSGPVVASAAEQLLDSSSAHTTICMPSITAVRYMPAVCCCVCGGGEGYLESKQCSQRLHKPCLILSTCHKRYCWAHCQDVKVRTCGCTALTEPHLPCCLLDLCSSCSAARHCCGAPPPWGPKRRWQFPAVFGRLAGHGSDG
ncbi:hypothetical protein COO60DRAFT_1181402 [Scenedesmus sp. NREL 46B-D3]|nr:hypothetical protein COO60DRAFT_1181402 [Scenedesmus sp. NREL 46B-D3]